MNGRTSATTAGKGNAPGRTGSSPRGGASGWSGNVAQPDVLKPPSGKLPQLLRGMKDILPVDQPYWNAVLNAVDAEARAFSFEYIEVPVLEATSLFKRSVGEATDIVEKEMYTFADKGGDSISLRPEFTASVARAYIEHGMLNQPQPVKLYTVGPLFRYERPQAGRFRQHTQFNFEVIGEAHSIVDAQLMLLLDHFYRGFELTPSFQINSIGDANCRPAYVKLLKAYAQKHKEKLCEDCRERLQQNPLRLLDCKQPGCHEVLRGAPQTVDHLCEACKDHFVRVLEYLDEVDVSYVLNPRLVRGLDYYTRTTFEVWASEDETGAQAALGGGGRYDGLIEQLCGRPTPAVGFGVGIERVVHLLKERGFTPPLPAPPMFFVAQLGEPARKRALKLFNDLRAEGYRVAEAFSKEGIKHQLEVANRLKVQFALIIGHKEMIDETILIRDMESGIQEVLDFAKVMPELRKRLEKLPANGETSPVPAA